MLVKAAPLVVALVAGSSFFTPATARADPPARLPTPFDGIGPDLVAAFSGWALAFDGGAIAGTAIMAWSGADHGVRVEVQRHFVAPAFADASYYAGYVLPAVLAPGIYLVGLAAGDPKTAGAGSAALQALAFTLVTTGVLKWTVGRAYPLDGGDPSAPDRLDHPEHARTFRPFQEAWPLPAWPSGHTSSTVCIAAALTAYYPEEIWIPLVGYPVSLAIGVGMVMGDRHWASDVIAGALIGHGIGYAVGKGYRARLRGERREEASFTWRLAPMTGPGSGLAILGSW